MSKEEVKKIINDYIDSLDYIIDFSVNNEVEEIDRSTLDEEYIERKYTGISNVYIEGYKEAKVGSSTKKSN